MASLGSRLATVPSLDVKHPYTNSGEDLWRTLAAICCYIITKQSQYALYIVC
jgi:hypothetical protein